MENGGVMTAPAADAVKETTTQGFLKDVIEESKNQPVLVDFWAPWCGPCKQLTPILEKAVKAAKGKVKLAKMNIDEHPAIPATGNSRATPTQRKEEQEQGQRIANAVVTATVEGSTIELDIPVKVATEARKADKVTSATTQVGLITAQTKDVVVQVTDQYGDPFKGFKADDFVVKSDDKTIANATSATSDVAGKLLLTVISTTETGTGNVDVKVGDKTYMTIPVVVGSGAGVGLENWSFKSHRRMQQLT